MKYDEATEQFLRDAVTIKDPTPSPIGVRQALGITKALMEKKPGAAASMLAGRGIASLASREMGEEGEKTSAVDPVTINAIQVFEDLNDKYGREWHDWEPETVAQTLVEDYGVVIGDDGVNVVGALQTILNTNYAHEHWHVFEKVGHAFNTNVVDFSVLQPLDPHEVALTWGIITRLRPHQDFDSEVHAYMAASARNAGMVLLPVGLFPEEAQGHLDRLNNDLLLKASVSSIFNEHAKPSNEAEEVQLGRLKEIEEYLKDFAKGVE